MSNFFLRPVRTLAFLQLLAFYGTSAPAADAPIFPTDIRVETGVSFLGDARKEQADLYFPAKMAKDARLPAVLIIHGGGWVGGKRDAAREINIGSTLARNGYIGMSIDYKLSLGGQPIWPTTCGTARPRFAGFERTPSDSRLTPTASVSSAARPAGTSLPWSPSPPRPMASTPRALTAKSLAG